MAAKPGDGHGDRETDDGLWIRSILDRFESPLIRYAHHLTGSLDAARDIVQDVFLRLWRARSQSSPEQWGQIESHLAEWLYTVCRNRALDVRRKERRMSPMNESQSRSLEGAEPMHASPAPHDSSSNGVLTALGSSTGSSVSLDESQAEQLRRALQLLETLPTREQEILRLKFQSGLSYREISGVMNLSVTNVGVLIHNALKSIRAGMNRPLHPVPATATPIGRERVQS